MILDINASNIYINSFVAGSSALQNMIENLPPGNVLVFSTSFGILRLWWILMRGSSLVG